MANIRRSILATLLSCICAAGALLAFSAGAAQATITHEYLSRITEVPPKGPPPAEESVAAPGPLEGIGGLTVDAGQLYVADRFTSSRLDEFDASTGAFVSQFAQVPSPVYDLRQNPAVGHGTGETEVYVAGDEEGSETHGLVAVYGSDGKLQNIWKGADTPAGHFNCFECGPLGGVAVDNSGNPISNGRVYVSVPGQNVVDVFEPQAGGGEKYLTQLTGPEPATPFAEVIGVAVDQTSGDLVVIDGSNAVDVFEPAALGEYALARRLTGTPNGSFERVNDVAVDGGNGDVYVMESDRGAIDQFSGAGVYVGHLVGSSGAPANEFRPRALAVDGATHDLYVADEGRHGDSVEVFGPDVVIPDVTTEPASEVKAASAILHGTVNPDGAGPATCRFEWGTSASLGRVAPCEPEGVANANAPVAVHATLTGLSTDTTYYYRLQATNAGGTNPGEAFQDQQFSTPGPGIHEESASTVTSASASLSARIDPDNSATTYYFQYGTSTAYGSDVPAAPGLGLGSGKGDIAVGVHLQGLAAGTTYHYRVVALSEPGGEVLTVPGPDQTFATQAAGTQVTQPDGRSWELVTPPNKQGAGIIALGNEQGDDIQAAANGGGITYGATASFVRNPAGNRSIEVTQVISTRQVPGVWATADISTPHNEGAKSLAVGHSAEYKLFSTDLSHGLVEPADDTPLPPLPAGAERTLYLREADGAYKALVTAENVPPGTKFGNNGEGGAPVNFVSASPDFSNVVLGSSLKLTAASMPESEFPVLYEWSDGRLQLATVLPNGEPSSGDLGFRSRIVRHAISTDGSRLVWKSSGQTEGNHGSFVQGHLYLRDMAKGETVPVDAAQGAPEPATDVSQYSTASADDSRVFFTSSARLTSNSTVAGYEGEDLYAYELTSGAGEPLAGRLTDLTADANPEETAAVQGVIEASEDGSFIYFVAHGVLGDGAERGAVAGGDNLYVEHHDFATKAWSAPKLVAVLASGDFTDWQASVTAKQATARVAPNGRFLAFMSEKSLTGYENHDTNSDVPDEEVYLYDADTGRLTCTSCNPTGARPVGSTGSEHYEEKLWDYAETWGGRWVAGEIPGWTTTDLSTALYQSRYLSNSGRLFFNSSDALVPADVNGREDVYEYEPEGVGSCQGADHGQSASIVYTEQLGGCVGLISAGTSSEESVFMDASETGGDVFFLTLSRLAPQDYDTSIDLYDAHECTAAAPCAPPAALAPPPCTTGDACKGAPTPQPTLFGAPSSETFSGAGNVTPSSQPGAVTPRSSGQARKLAQALRKCRRKARKRRAACERQARRRSGAKRSRIAKSSSTRAGR